MIRILKWGALGAAVLVAAGFAVFGAQFPSYVGTGLHLASKAGRDKVPVEFELRRAETLIDGIVPEIQASRKVVAEEEVAIEGLSKEIVALESAQEKGFRKVRTLRDSLATPAPTFTFAGVSYSRTAVEKELERCFDATRSQDSLLESKRRLVGNRQKSLEAARSKLDAVRQEKVRLETVVQGLHAQLRQVQALEATSRFSLDASALARAKQAIENCQRRLDVAQKMLEQETFERPGIEIESGPDRDLLAEVDRYLGRGCPSSNEGTAVAAAGR